MLGVCLWCLKMLLLYVFELYVFEQNKYISWLFSYNYFLLTKVIRLKKPFNSTKWILITNPFYFLRANLSEFYPNWTFPTISRGYDWVTHSVNSLMEVILKIQWCSQHRGLRGFTSHPFAHSLVSLCASEICLVLDSDHMQFSSHF